ncbi:MAG: hypothetical protein O3B73_19120 [bacterium]|nr:hypothetical protein [bacterium]
MTQIIDQLASEMHRRFGTVSGDVQVVRSPYRICPLGAHIDHQHGPVTAMAIDQAAHLAFAPSGDSQVRLASLTFEGTVAFDLRAVPDKTGSDWGNYARGAVRALQAAGHVLSRGIVGVTSGSMNEGGLSSSAAIGLAFLLALENANGLTLSAEQNVRLDQAIENGYIGLKNGILDPSAILFSRRNHLTVIDCATATHALIAKSPALPPFDILIAQSGLKEALIGTGYNTRVEECRQAASILLNAAGREEQDSILGNVTADEYRQHGHRLSGAIARRAEHFFSEAGRVHRGVDAWQSGDLCEFGRLISQSGYSSIHNYECGSQPLIDLYHILIATEGVYGARFSGAGFRGCCVALVDPLKSAAALDHVRVRYQQKHSDLARKTASFTCQPDGGARIL